jgi:pimeloyl-ACP methyl ester carboxylesterase
LGAMRTLTLLLVLSFSLALSAEPAVTRGSVDLKSGLTVHYVAAGRADAPPLLLLHGLGDTNRSWSLVLPELAKSHRVYAIDQRGHGATSSPACCYTMPELAYDAVTFLDAMKIERAAVVGHSLGSFVAQVLAARHPERVTRLVLIGSADTTHGMDMLEWLLEQARAMNGAPGAEFIDQWQQNAAPVDEEFLAQVKRETAIVRPHVWKTIAQNLMTEDHRRFVREIRTPVLILWGEKDHGFLLAQQEGLRKLLPHAEFKAYANLGHNPHWEQPSVVAKDLRAFLEEETVLQLPVAGSHFRVAGSR